MAPSERPCDALPSAPPSGVGAATVISGARLRARPADIDTVTLDWAYYNPVSLVVRQEGWLEQELEADGIDVRWVQSLGSNKALEFLNAGSLDFGSTAGAAALLAQVNGNPIKIVWVFSKPEWTALVTRPDTGIAGRGPQGQAGGRDQGHRPVHLPAPGTGQARARRRRRRASSSCSTTRAGWRWSAATSTPGPGLDPMMADVELTRGSPLFYRDTDANTYGVLNVREAFAAEHPELVQRVLEVYERGRQWALENPEELA